MKELSAPKAIPFIRRISVAHLGDDFLQCARFNVFQTMGLELPSFCIPNIMNFTTYQHNSREPIAFEFTHVIWNTSHY